MFHDFKPFLHMQLNPIALPWARLPLTSFWEHCLSQGLQDDAGSNPRDVIFKETVQSECLVDCWGFFGSFFFFLQILSNLTVERQGKMSAVMQLEGCGESPARHLSHHFERK